VRSSSLSSVPTSVYIILSKVVLVVMLLIHCFDGLTSSSLLLSVLFEAALGGHGSLTAAVLLAIVITVSSLNKSVVGFAGRSGKVADQDFSEFIVIVCCLLSQRGTVEKWFDLRLILGHVKSICSSIKDLSGLRVLNESVCVVNVVGCVVVGLDLGHLYWLLLT
jgi:hypothetical protein